MSSGDTSSAAESPESFNGTAGAGLAPRLSEAALNSAYELGDFAKRHSASIGGKVGGHSASLEDERESTVETSSQASSYAASGGVQGSDAMDDSLNPLYEKGWAEDFA